MKKTPLLNIALSRLIASLGHGDILVIGDAGLPVPPGVELIDLALGSGLTPAAAEAVASIDAVMHKVRRAIQRRCLCRSGQRRGPRSGHHQQLALPGAGRQFPACQRRQMA